MGQASIVVDIKAQISGYQEQLDKIKAAASKIDIGSQLGKNLSREIAAAQKQLDALGKTPMPRLTSEGAIDSLTSKFNNIAHIINEIGLAMQGATFNDINIEEFNRSIASLRQQWLDTRKEFDQKVDLGIKDALKDAPGLRNYLKQIGVDLENLTAESAKNALAERLEQARIKAEQTAEAFDELTQKQQALQKEIDNMSGSNSLAEKLKTDLEQVSALNFDAKKIANIDKIEEVKKRWQQQLEIFTKGLDLDKQKDIVNNAINSLFSEENLKLSPEGFSALAGNFNMQLKNALSDSMKKGDISQLFKQVFGTRTGVNSDTLIKDIFGIDEKAIQEAKDKLNNILQGISLDEISEKDRQETQELIDSGKFTEAVNRTKELLTSKINELEKLLQEKKAELEKLNSEVLEAGKAKRLAKADATRSGRSVEQLNALIAEKEKENAELKQRVEELGNALKEQEQKTVEEIRETGKTSSHQAAQELDAAARAANVYKTELEQVQAKEQLVGKIEGVVQQWFSIYAAVRMVGQVIRSIVATVRELDQTITQIAIVTDMSQDDLWREMPKYTAMAREYATSIAGVYEVSQLFYQQGLQTNDVMAMTEQTLKMARISGLSYSDATNYMTNAVRSFKMEMQDAQTVVDVYSEIAASSATSTSELSTAMSKTASSAESVGSSFENTTAMMAVMIEATREGAENIGSAMKSIISRYGEMKENPEKLTDSEGEEMSLNKVDKALQTVGISIHDTAGQFREFDDVIFELAEKWDTIDKNTQRYIATVMAGNRQQSRFLALVSNGERLAELSEKAANSQDAAALQVLKTMDSIEAKTQQLKTTLQSLYIDSGIENMYKGILDFANNLAKSLSELGTIAGIPIEAIGKVALTFMSLSNTVTTVFGLMRNRVKLQMAALSNDERTEAQKRLAAAEVEAIQKGLAEEKRAQLHRLINGEITQEEFKASRERIAAAEQEAQAKANAMKGLSKGWAIGGAALSLAGTAISGYAANLDIEKDRQKKAIASGIGTMTQLTGLGASMGGVWGAAIGAGIGAITGAVQALGIATEETEEKITRLGHAVEETGNKKLQSKDNLQTLIDYKKKYDELATTRNKDAESRKEWIKLNNDIAASYPELISQMDVEGNKIVDMTDAYQKLADAKLNAYKNDFLSNTAAELGAFSDLDYVLKNLYGVDPIESQAKSFIGLDFDQAPKIVKGLLQNNLPKSLSPQSINRLFGAGYTIDTGSGERVDTKYAQSTFIDILNEFNKLAQDNISFIDAQAQLSSQFGSEYESAITNFDNTIYEALQAGYSAIEFQDTIIANKITSANQEWINIISQMADMDVSDLQKDVMADQMAKEWEIYYKENKDKIQTITNSEGIQEQRTLEPGELYQEFLKQYQAFWINQFLQDNQELNNEAINELYKDIGKSTASDIRLGLGKYKVLSEEVRQILLDEFDKQYTDTINNFKEHINELKVTTENSELQGKLIAIRDGLSTLIGPEYLDGIAAQFENILNNTGISDSHKNLQFDGLMRIYTEISKLDENLRQSALSAAEGADFTSLTGIHDFIKSLEDTGIDLDATGLRKIIRNFGQTLNINFETEIQTYINKVTAGMEDFDKSLNSISKGMDFKTASELANTLGKTLSKDFDLREGLYFFEDFEAIKDHYIQANKEQLVDLKIQSGRSLKNLMQMADVLKRFDNQQELDAFLKENQASFGTLGLNISTVSSIWQQASEQGIDIIAAATQYFSDSLQEAEQAGQAYANQRIATMALSNGYIDAFLDSVQEIKNDVDEKAAREAFNTGDIDYLIKTFPEFASILLDKYQNLSLDIFNKAIDATEQGSAITIDPKNFEQKTLLDKLVELQLAEALDEGTYKLVEVTQDTLNGYLTAIDESGLTNSQKASERAKAKTAAWDKSVDKLLQDVYKNVSSVNQETYENLVNEFGLEAIQAISQSNNDNTYAINVSGLQQLVQNSGKKISDATFNMGEEAIQKTADDILKQISEASSLVTKGTTSPESMQKFVTDFNKATGKSLKIQDLFSFSDVADGFTLNTGVFREYASALRNQLIKAGMAAKDAEHLIQQMTDEIRNSVDIKGYLDSDKGELNVKALKAQLEAYYNELSTLELANKAGISSEDFGNENIFLKSINARRNKIISGLAENDIAIINEGGKAAVDMMRAMSKDNVLSTEEIALAYRGQVIELEKGFEQISANVGDIVSGSARAILEGIESYELEDLGDGSAVVKVIGDTTEAYRRYYGTLYLTGEATLTELNNAYAKILESDNSDESFAISALNDAAGMTYQRFGEILAEKGKELTIHIIDQYTEQLGPNRIRITDFSKFAQEVLNITDFSSPEYISAFKTYNDSLIEMNHQIERNIVDEVKNLSAAKGGDWVNLIQLTSAIGDELTNILASQLALMGGSLNSGVLELKEGANLPLIINTIINTAQQYGGLLESDMAALADALDAVLKSYAEKISKGIKGGLSNVEALDLQNIATSLDKNLSLQFIETQEGLRVSEKSAIDLYNALQKIDAMQSTLVFDELSKSLKENNESYDNVSTIMAHIASLQKEINNLPVSDARRQEYEAELAVAEKILNVRSATDPNSFKFMDRDMPDAFNSPINYWNAAGKAYTAMNESAKSGYMEIQDFYNIVNEMTNMAQMTGQNLEFMGATIDGSSETAARLIQQGMSALSNIDGKGVKIALKNLGGDFQIGAGDMSKGFDTGLKSVAKAQIAMLDSAINMLEAIVAMENIDVSGDGHLDLGEIFTIDSDTQQVTGFTKETDEWLKQIENSCGNIEIGGKTLREALLELGTIDPQKAEELMNALYSIDWTLGDADVFSQIQNVLSVFFPGRSITQGESIFDLLQVPKNAEDTSKEFHEWLSQINLDAEEAKALLNTLGDGTIDARSTGKYGEAIKSILGIDDSTQEAFDKFIQDSKINAEEIKLWKKMNIEAEEDGTVTKAEYKASDGSIHPLSKESPENWQEEIKQAEEKVLIAGHTGEDSTEVNLDNSNVSTVTLSDETTVEGVIQGTDGNFTAYYNGKSCPVTNMEEANEWIRQQAELEFYKIGETGGVTTRENEVTGEMEVVPVYKVTGKATDKTKESVNNLVNMSYEDAQKYIEENQQFSADGKTFTLPDIPIEFEASTGTDKVQQIVDSLFGEGSFDELPSKIAQGIIQAFSEGDAASQIGAAIASGMATALAGADGKTQEVPIPEITIKPSKINFDTTGLAAAAKEQGSTATPTEVPIDSIKVKPSTIVLDASGAQPTGEGATIPEIPLSSVKATVSTLELTSVASATLAEGVEPNLKDVAAKGDASSLELTLTALGATLAGGNTVNIEGAINSKGEVGTLAVTLAEGKQGTLEHTGDVDVGNVGSVSGTSDNAKISATNYTVTFAKEDGSTEIVEVEGFANLTATLSKYGVGFDENGNLQNVGDYKVTVTPTDDNIELTTSANMEGVETNVAQYEANRVLKFKGEVDFSEESTEPESILNKTIQKNADLGDSYAGAISTATEGAIQNWQQYEDKVVEVVGTTGSLNSIDIDSLVNMGSFNENLGGVNVSLDNLMTRLQALGPQGQTVGQQIIDGLVAADASASDAAATNLGESFITNLKNALGVSSPSIYAQEAGQNVVQGLANGLSDISVAVSAAEALAKAINEALQNITIKPNISLENPNNSNKGGLSGLNNTDLSGTKQSTDEIKENINVIGKTKFSNLSKLNSNLKEAAADAQATATNVANIQNKDFSVTATTDVTENKQVNEEHNVTETKVVNNVSNTEINADTSGAQKAAADLSAAARKTVSPLGSATNKITSLGNATKAIQDKGTFVSRLASAMRNIPTNAAEAVSKLKQAMSGIPTGKKTLDVEVKVNVTGGGNGASVSSGGKTGNFKIYSKGNFTGLAAAKGRKTLMGELGPELVVAGGRYYTVGNTGPEFVNLPDDAIVFNHLQTERLLKGKKVNGRGEAATTEKNAVALAAGTTGPAMASASAALAALKEIRAMWQSMLDASAQSLGAQAGRGGGGGKGGKGGKGCFAAGTLITTNQGYKKIEDIQKGDIVLSYNEKSKQNEYSKVLQTMIHDVEDLIYTLYIQNEALTVTGIHKFLISGRGWIPASELQIGDLVLFANGVWHQIDDIQTEFEALRVYNFEVSNNHNYYVGNNQVLAHNKGGGGGGGGSGDDGEEIPEWSIQYKTVTEEIERWYNLIRQIDKIEQDIAYQAALRNKYESDRVANGEKIYKTYQKEYGLLRQEVQRQQELVYLQKSWYDAKRKELEESTYGKIFTYDENGLQQYTGTGKPGSGEGLDILENLTRRNVEGKAIGNAASAKAQLAYLKRVGFDINQLRYNEDGTVLAKLTSAAVEKALKKEGKTWSSDGKGQAQKKKDIAEKQEEIRIQMMENFWSQVDGWKDELDSLYDSYNESLTKIEENQTKQNEILQKLVDNELSIEQDIIKAIEAREQAAIDALEEQKKVIEDANKKFLDGLNKQLSQEKELYNQNKKENDFTKLQRQLEILRRSGGSATQIKQLQDQIDSQMKDNYFDQQQKQIDAMQEASDAQIQRLDTQIDLMKTSLEYQKEHGLLWAEVRQMMADLTAAEVWSKISQWNPEYLEQSGLDLEESMRDFLERFGIYWEGKNDQSKFSEELSKQDFINDEELNKAITSSSLSDTQKGEAQKRANAQAQEAYKNARMAGETEEEALEQAKTAYQNTAQQYIENIGQKTKNAVIDKERAEGGRSESQSTFETFITNDEYLNKLSDKEGWYSNLSSSQKSDFENEYYKNIKAQYDNGETIDRKQALRNAYDAIENSALIERTDGFQLLKNAAIYKKVAKNKFTKQKQTLNKDTVFILTGLSGNYAQVQKKSGGNKYWVLKSMIPAEELAAYKTNESKTEFDNALIRGNEQQQQYDDLLEQGLEVSGLNISTKTTLGKNIKYKDVNANGVNVTKSLTDNTGKLKQKITSLHIKSIKQLDSNGQFKEILLDKINGKSLTTAYKLTWNAAKKAKLSEIIKAAILNKILGADSNDSSINFAYKQGGLVDYTGPAWVDGTKKQPEAFLNAKQTDFLRNDLLGNSRTSLLSIVSELREILDNTSSASVDNSNSVVIENIELNFESGVISNDYSAKRAGDMAMQEILKIARKTGANTISRR